MDAMSLVYLLSFPFLDKPVNDRLLQDDYLLQIVQPVFYVFIQIVDTFLDFSRAAESFIAIGIFFPKFLKGKE